MKSCRELAGLITHEGLCDINVRNFTKILMKITRFFQFFIGLKPFFFPILYDNHLIAGTYYERVIQIMWIIPEGIEFYKLPT